MSDFSIRNGFGNIRLSHHDITQGYHRRSRNASSQQNKIGLFIAHHDGRQNHSAKGQIWS